MKHPENSNEYKGLTVNAGVENLPSVNPYATFRRKKQVLSADEYVEGILRGDMRLLSQAVTLIESNLPSDQVIAQQVIENAYPTQVTPSAWELQVYLALVNQHLSKHLAPRSVKRAST